MTLPPESALRHPMRHDPQREDRDGLRSWWSQVANVVARTPHEPGLFLVLAPMDGITDWAWRGLMTELDSATAMDASSVATSAHRSGISLCVSEFVRVTRDPVGAAVLLRDVPELARGGHTRAGVPVYVQLLGGQPQPMAESAALAVELGAPGIDLNFGCPAKIVNNHDGGATLLKCPRRVEGVVAAVRAAVPAHVPVTAKIRLGWDSSAHVEDIARAAEAGGAAWLTIHARTRMQGYHPPVDWRAIGRARAVVRMPVVANGDVNTPADLLACAEQSACTAFMIGRGAMGVPNLFRLLRGWDDEIMEREPFIALLERFVTRLLEASASSTKALNRVKQWLRLAAHVRPDFRPLFDSIKVQHELAMALSLLAVARNAGDPANAAVARDRATAIASAR